MLPFFKRQAKYRGQQYMPETLWLKKTLFVFNDHEVSLKVCDPVTL